MFLMVGTIFNIAKVNTVPYMSTAALSLRYGWFSIYREHN